MYGKYFLAFFYGNGYHFPLPDELLNAIGFSKPGSIVLDNDYCYFLENNIYPPDDNTALPVLL